MLKLLPIVYFFYTIPEGILGAYASFVLSNEKINWKKLILSGLFFSITTYMIRLLPVKLGIHTMLILLAYIFIVIKFNHIYYIRAIISCTFFMVALFISEQAVLYILIQWTRLSIIEVLNSPLEIFLFGIPSLFMVFVLIRLVAFIVIPKLYKDGEKDEHC